MSNHSCRGCSAVVKRSTPTGVIRARFPDIVKNIFPFGHSEPILFKHHFEKKKLPELERNKILDHGKNLQHD